MAHERRERFSDAQIEDRFRVEYRDINQDKGAEERERLLQAALQEAIYQASAGIRARLCALADGEVGVFTSDVISRLNVLQTGTHYVDSGEHTPQNPRGTILNPEGMKFQYLESFANRDR